MTSPSSFLSRRLGEFEEDVWLVTHDPAVMTRVDDRNVARTELHLGPVVHTDALAAGDEDLDVTSLAALSADGRLDVRRPTPTRLESLPCEGQAANRHRIDLCLLRCSCRVGGVEALSFEPGHLNLLSWWE